MIKRLIPTIPLALCLLALAKADVSGQPGGSAPSDSLESGRILDRIQFHPSYQTGFQVNRTSTQWDQSFDLSRRIAFLDFSNRWNVSNRRDSAQSDLRQRRGQMTFRLDYRLADYGSWTVGLDGDFQRSSQLSSFRDIVDNKSNFGLAARSKLPEQILHRLLSPVLETGAGSDAPPWAINLDTGANFGLNREDGANRQSTLIDTTHVAGWFQSYDVTVNGKVRQALNLKIAMVSDKRSGDSRTRQRSALTGELIQEIDDTSDSRRLRWDGTLQWKPRSSLNVNGSGRVADEVNRYWDTQANDRQGGQETKDGKDRGGRIQFEWRKTDPRSAPPFDYSLRGEFSTGDLRGDYDLQQRGFHKQSRKTSLDGRVVLPTLSGPAAGTELTLTYADEVTDNSLEQTADYRQNSRRLRASVLRKLGSKFQVQTTEEVSLQQYFYEDGSNDRDELRTLTTGTLNYRPSMAFNGLFTVTWNRRETVNVPEEKAASNNTGQSYVVSGDLTYTRGRMSVNQRYTVEAAYTFFDFNENNNNLIRTNSVNTTFRGGITNNIGITVTHQYEFRDQGQYVRDSADEPRQYAPSTEETRHVLTLGATYAIGRIVKIDARQLFDKRQKRFATSGRVTGTERAEFSVKANLEQDISKDFKVRMSFQKTESSAERNYWTGRADIERRF